MTCLGVQKHIQIVVVITSTGGDVVQGLSGFPKKSVLCWQLYQPLPHEVKQTDVEMSIRLKHTLTLVFKSKYKLEIELN